MHCSRGTHNPGRPADVILTTLFSPHDEHELGPVQASQLASQPWKFFLIFLFSKFYWLLNNKKNYIYSAKNYVF